MTRATQTSHVQRPGVVVVVADDVPVGAAFVARSERDVLLGEVPGRLFFGVLGVIHSCPFDEPLPMPFVLGGSDLDPPPAASQRRTLGGAELAPSSSDGAGTDGAGSLLDHLGSDDTGSGAVPLRVSGIALPGELDSALGTQQYRHVPILAGILKKRE